MFGAPEHWDAILSMAERREMAKLGFGFAVVTRCGAKGYELVFAERKKGEITLQNEIHEINARMDFDHYKLYWTMGVWGLLSFLQMGCPSAASMVSYPRIPLSDSKRIRCTLIVDGSALVYHLFQQCPRCIWWDGGELRDLFHYTSDWIRALRSCGIEPVVILDGMCDPFKEQTAISRGQENSARVEAVLRYLRQCGGEEPQRADFVLPLGAMETMV
jgi:hypothetical protein